MEIFVFNLVFSYEVSLRTCFKCKASEYKRSLSC
jgi:hypothetical protein